MSSSPETGLEFLQAKWKAWFKSLDVNKDGVLSREDYTGSEQDFENFYKSRVDEKTLESMREGFRLFWEDFIFRGIAHQDTINEEDFIASLTKEYQADPDGLHHLARRMFTAICQCADADRNGFISFEEFAVLFRAFGYKDEKVMEEMYEHYGPVEKGVGVMEFTESWIDIAIGPDHEKVNIPYHGFLTQLRGLVSC